MTYRIAEDTANYKRLHAAFKPVSDALIKSVRSSVFSFGPMKDLPDEYAIELNQAIKNLLPLLEITFSDGRTFAPAYMKNITKFKKMLLKLQTATTGAALAEVISSIKDVWSKYFDNREEILSLVKAFDEELLESYAYGPYTIQPFNTGRGDWTDGKFQTVNYILKASANLLNKHGMGRFIGGSVLAYPTRFLPPSSGSRAQSATAMYSPKQNIMWLAAGVDNPIHAIQSFIHETGHRVYYRFLTATGRAAWEQHFEEKSGTPDVDAVIRAWETWASAPASGDTALDESDRIQYGRYLSYWYSYLSKSGDSDLLMWTEIIARNANLRDEINPRTGIPAKGAVPALDQLIAKRNEVKSYLTPVTAYSASEPAELFAEAFAHYIVYGPNRLHPQLRAELRTSLPMLRTGSSPLSLQRDYGADLESDLLAAWGMDQGRVH